MALGICTSCRRFARGASCPFCGSAVGAPLPGVQGRSTRARRVVGATAVVVAIGCGGSEPLPAPAYGGPPIEAGAVDAPNDSSPKDATPDTIMGAYGGPPVDAGSG